MRTYGENESLPNNCWFLDWRPRSSGGEILIRERDENSTTTLIVVPVSRYPDVYGLDFATAERIANVTLAIIRDAKKGTQCRIE